VAVKLIKVMFNAVSLLNYRWGDPWLPGRPK